MRVQLQTISRDEEAALVNVITGETTDALAANAAQKMLSNLGMRARELGISPADVMEAFGQAQPLLSVDGAYYKLQHFILSFGGPVVGTAITAAGIATTLHYIKKGLSAGYGAISKAVSSFASVSTATPGVLGAPAAGQGLWTRLFHAVVGDEVRDGAEVIDPSVFSLALATSVPAPVLYLVNAFGGALQGGDTGNEFGGGQPRAVAPPAATPTPPSGKAGGSGSASSTLKQGLISTGVSLAGQALGSLLSKGLSYFGASGVADEVRDDLTEEVNQFGTYLHNKYGLQAPEDLDDGGPQNMGV